MASQVAAHNIYVIRSFGMSRRPPPEALAGIHGTGSVDPPQGGQQTGRIDTAASLGPVIAVS
jgi:hypothetical protein